MRKVPWIKVNLYGDLTYPLSQSINNIAYNPLQSCAQRGSRISRDSSPSSLYISFGLFLLVFSSRERLEDFEGGNIPPQRYAAPPKFKSMQSTSLPYGTLRFAPQTTRLSSSSTIFEGENIPPQRPSACSPWIQNQQSWLVKVADIRLLRGKSLDTPIKCCQY